MKKLYLLLIIISSFSYTVFALNWGDGYWTVSPSSVPNLTEEGASFPGYFTDKKYPTIKYQVYNDIRYAFSNGDWVHAQWRQDHGWRYDWERDGWTGNSYAVHPVRGALYIDPHERVAIYFYVGGGMEVFRVRVLNK